MNIELLILVSFGSMAALWYLFNVDYKKYLEDKLRQTLFEIRADLFEAGRTHNLFDTDAYRLTRNTLNGMLRCAPEFTLRSMFIFTVLSRPHAKLHGQIALRYESRLRDSIQSIHSDARAAIYSARRQAHVAIFVHLIKTSAILGIPFLLLGWILHAFHLMDLAHKKLLASTRINEQLSILDAEANQAAENQACYDARLKAA